MVQYLKARIFLISFVFFHYPSGQLWGLGWVSISGLHLTHTIGSCPNQWTSFFSICCCLDSKENRPRSSIKLLHALPRDM
jgi:hypothetical protein